MLISHNPDLRLSISAEKAEAERLARTKPTKHKESKGRAFTGNFMVAPEVDSAEYSGWNTNSETIDRQPPGFSRNPVSSATSGARTLAVRLASASPRCRPAPGNWRCCRRTMSSIPNARRKQLHTD